MSEASLRLRLVDAISKVDAKTWDKLCDGRNPFVSYAFLSALEESKSVHPANGWLPQHALLENDLGEVLGAAPLYLKSHSYGEYVFDHSWADAWERAGGSYYPKALSAVPFTPVPGPRLLVAEGAEREVLMKTLATGLAQVLGHSGEQPLSSLHLNFVEKEQADLLEAAGYQIRHGMQFHWHNQGYETFDDFLETLASRKRKAIKKERRQVAEAGVELKVLRGEDIKPAHWDAFFHFYLDTSDRKWGSPYLTRAFFDLLGERMADKVALVLAYKEERIIAGALNLIGKDSLYGRNWGCVEDFKFLHFEACYYQAIDLAIQEGLQTVEAGAQGYHKLQRGYLPVTTYSAHFIADQGFAKAVRHFLDAETRAVKEEIKALMEESPYKAG